MSSSGDDPEWDSPAEPAMKMFGWYRDAHYLTTRGSAFLVIGLLQLWTRWVLHNGTKWVPIVVITLSAAPPSQRAAALGQARVYRLALERDFSAFAGGLRAAGVNAVFPTPGSSAPYR